MMKIPDLKVYTFAAWASLAGLSVFGSQASATIAFQDVTTSSGIGHSGASFGASWGDFNGDGLPDLWVGNHATPPSLYQNNGDGTFSDVAGSVWPGPARDSHGAAWADFDRDGDQDLIEVAGGSNSNQLWLNESGTFVDVATLQGVGTPGARSRTPLWVDWNRDSQLDLVLTQASGNGTFPLIMQNTGTGFVDATADVGASFEASTSAYLSDLTGDGILDLAIMFTGALDFPASVYDLSTAPFTLRPDLSNPLRTVSDATFADFNGDLKMDIFAVRAAPPQQLAVRSDTEIAFSMTANGDEKSTTFAASDSVKISIFSGSTASLFVGETGFKPDAVSTPELRAGSFYITLDPTDPAVQGIAPHTAGTDQGTYIGFDTQDGSWKISHSSPTVWATSFIVTSPSAITDARAIGYPATPVPPSPAYYIRTASGFEDRSSQNGLGAGLPCLSVVSGDFDNDMDVDLYAACTLGVANIPNTLMENLGDGTFSVIANAGGAAGSQAGKSDSVVVADYDQDGFLDLFLTNGNGPVPFNGGPHQLFRNSGNSNNWLEIDLVGIDSNPDAIGATVYVTVGGITQIREQNGGVHTFSQNHQRLHFGLADNTLVEKIEVIWPNGFTNSLTNVSANQVLTILERDQDEDGVADNVDNCPTISNSLQSDLDDDGEGNACEAPEANGFWLDFDNPDSIVHIQGLYFHRAQTEVFFNGNPAADVTFLDQGHIVATVPNGQTAASITVTTPNGTDSVPETAAFIDRGGGLIYDTQLNITWLQDANYAATSGFSTDGLMTWPMAMSWAAGLSYYDSVRDKTWTDWRLPTAMNPDASGPCFDLDCSQSEMGHLHYISKIKQASPGPFLNHKISSYWSSTGRAPLSGIAWLFAFGIGKQDFTGPLEELLASYAWAVRDGDVAGNLPFANNDSFSVSSDLQARMNLALNDTHPDDGLDLSSIRILSGPFNGRILSINSDGTVEYLHNGDETIADSFTYTIDDLTGATSNTATVQISTNLLDSNSDGISDAAAAALGLDPNDPDGDTDDDGISDVVEVGGNVNAPLDSDADGVIDAIEPGADASNANLASALLPEGQRVVIKTATGETLSNVVSQAAATAPAGISFPFGAVSYTTTAPAGGSVPVSMSFSEALPGNLALFKVDQGGVSTQLPDTLWTQIDDHTIDIILTDGDPGTDLDGIANGSIDDPLAVGSAIPTPTSGGGGGGGGGCSSNPANRDPSFLLMTVLSLCFLSYRRFLSKRRTLLTAKKERQS